MKIICPNCYGETVIASTYRVTKCNDCNHSFTVDDLDGRIGGESKIRHRQYRQIGSWVSNFSDREFWGQTEGEDSFWGHYM